MTDEQINQLFDLKQKLDAGAISQEVFDKEKAAIVYAVDSKHQDEANSQKSTKMKWLRVLFITMLGLVAFVFLCIWIKSKTFEESPNPPVMDGDTSFSDEVVSTDCPVNATSMTAREVDYRTGNWGKEDYVDEYGDNTYEPQFKLHLYVENLKTHKEYDLFIIYKPNDYFELNGLDEYWGYNKLKVRDDNIHSEVNINYKVYTRHHTQNYIRIEQKNSIARFIELIEDGDFTLLLNENDVCHVNGATCGLTEIMLKHRIDDTNIPVTSYTGKKNMECMEKYAKYWKQLFLKDFGSYEKFSKDSCYGHYGLLNVDEDDIPEFYVYCSGHGYLLSIKNNAVITLLSFYDEWCDISEYIPRKSLIMLETSDCEFNHKEILSIVNGEARKIVSATNFDVTSEGEFAVNDKKGVTETEYNSALINNFYSKGEAWNWWGRSIGILMNYASKL